MEKRKQYVLSVDQSTQGTKALLFSSEGELLGRADVLHEQKIDNNGWVSHDMEEIYHNVLSAIQNVVREAGVNRADIACLGISNQRETALAWNRETGKTVCDAIVWQCSRSKDICEQIVQRYGEDAFWDICGIPVSPFFPASKFAWILKHVPEAKRLSEVHSLCMGTVDTWLVYKLTAGKEYKTDYSNASRTALLNLRTLTWDETICSAYGIESDDLAQICDSDAVFGMTDLEGFLDEPIPISGVLGDSHAALFGQGCLSQGMAKATFGTGTSVMMNTGDEPVLSAHGLVTSLAWKFRNRVSYVMEGNLNYTGAVIRWMQKEVGLISSAAETETLAREADFEDTTYLVPAFTGLGAPYWCSEAKAMFCGMTRRTGRAELVKAGLECIAYQIADIINAMEQDAGFSLGEVRVDGGAANNGYLLQFLSDIIRTVIKHPDAEELSGIGAAYLAGIAGGIYDDRVFEVLTYASVTPKMPEEMCSGKYQGWLNAVALATRVQS